MNIFTHKYLSQSIALVGVISVIAVFTACSRGDSGTSWIDLGFNRDSTNYCFTKICNDGSNCSRNAELGSAASDWGCTRDDITGLIWEVKTPDNSSSTYTNHDNTGDSSIDIESSSNTLGYQKAVNQQSLCGATDWRLPTADELQSIVNYSKVFPANFAIWFPNAQQSYYWSSSPVGDETFDAWRVYFVGGIVDYDNRDFSYAVRLVRKPS